MATRTLSTSSSVTETDATSSRVRNASETSADTTHSGSQLRDRSPTNTIDGTSVAETATIRSVSQASASRTGTDAISVATVASSNSQAPSGGIPVIRPPVFQHNPGPVAPPRQAPQQTQPTTALSVDVNAARQQQPGLSSTSSYTGSSSTASGSSTSSPGGASTNVRPGPAPTKPSQPQFPNQIPRELIYNELLGPDAFKDVILDIDYGAIGDFNVPFSSGSDVLGPKVPQGLNIRPAYTTVDSLNYQQHMFNSGRTIYADAQNTNFDVNAFGDQYNTGMTGQQFDVSKAIFNQVDVNHDGRISRDEFQQWAQGGMQQGYSNNYQTQQTVNNYDNVQYQTNNVGQGATVLDGGNPDIDQILQASGLNQALKK